LGFREVPECPFCGDPVAIETLEARRLEALKELRGEHRPAPARARARARARDELEIPFSIPVFLGLAFFFWPGALAYVFFKYQKAR
jgi:hypothetical protein